MRGTKGKIISVYKINFDDFEIWGYEGDVDSDVKSKAEFFLIGWYDYSIPFAYLFPQ